MASPSFTLTHETRDGALVIRASGKFDREAGLAVQELAEGCQGPRVLNLAEIEYMSSTGIAFLVKLSSSLGVRVASPAACVRETLGLAGIERIVTLFADEAAALASG